MRHIGQPVYQEIVNEMRQQDATFGPQEGRPMGTHSTPQTRTALAGARARYDREKRDGNLTWEHVLSEEFWEAVTEEDPARLRAELIQLAAVATRMAQELDLILGYEL